MVLGYWIEQKMSSLISHCGYIFTYEQQQHDEDAAEIKLLKNRLSNLEKMQSSQRIKSKQEKLCMHC